MYKERKKTLQTQFNVTFTQSKIDVNWFTFTKLGDVSTNLGCFELAKDWSRLASSQVFVGALHKDNDD